MTTEEARAREKLDAEIDARSREYIRLQCRFCKYRLLSLTNGSRIVTGCDYISWEGHSTDKGNGPGDCRSFKPLKAATKEETRARRLRNTW